MRDGQGRWETVTPSQFPHEREALEHVRLLLPDAEPYRAWSNFTFTATTGHIREVDLLVVARGGVYLIEIKSLVGRLTASGSNWTQHRDSGNTRIFDNPLHLANQKSKELRSLLENAGRASRTKIPFIQPAVFLSNPTLRVEFDDHQLHWVFGPERGAPGGAASGNTGKSGSGGGRGGVMLPSIWSGLLDTPLRDERQRVTPGLSKALAKLLPAAGIARSRRHQRVGSWQLEFPAFDSGPTWQDYHAAHTQVASERRRVRIYLVERAAGEAERANREAVARREFLVLHGINHPGIVQVDGLEGHEAGPALIFRHRPDEMRLDHYLDRYGDRLDAGTRLHMIRQLAEAVAYAHGRHLYHRALAARSVLVVPSGGRGRRAGGNGGGAGNGAGGQGWLAPKLMISDWQAAARDAGSGTGTGTLTNAMTTRSLELAVEPAARFLPHLELAAAGYLAPEIGAPYPDPVGIDVFGLGALAYLILTGQPPADSPNALKARLEQAGGLHPAEVVDSLSEAANDVVAQATCPLPDNRYASVGELLDWLLLAENELTPPDVPAATPGDSSAGDGAAGGPPTDPPAAQRDEQVPETDPLEAQRGDLVGGEWRIRERLGTGSTSRAFLARNEKTNRDEVLKVALSDERAARLEHEASVLGRLNDSRVIRLARPDTLVIGGRTVLVLDHAGEQTVARKLREGRLSVDELETYSDYLFGAVDYLDGEGVAHRDLKPDNIVIRRRPNRTYQLVLIDFSLANISVRDTAAGTPRYLDPFLGAGTRATYDDHAERYALAVTLHEMASGELPLWGDGSTGERFTEGPPTVATEAFDPAIRSGLASFFPRALDRDAARRFASLKDMRDAWQAVFRAADSTPPTPSIHPAGTRPAGAAGAAAGERAAQQARDLAAATAAADTPLEAAGLSPRAVSAAHRLNVTTVGVLLTLGSKEIISLPGTGAKTRQELQSRIRQWRRALAAASADAASADAVPAGTPAQPTPAGQQPADAPSVMAMDYARMPVEALADRLLPHALSGGRNATEREATRLLLGLPDAAGALPDVAPWAPQQQVAERVGVTSGRIAQVLTARRRAWHADDAVRSVRDELVEILGDAGRVMGFDELATAVLARHGSQRSPAERHALAAAAVRAALETVDLDSEPCLARRRFYDRTLVALEAAEDDGPLTPAAPALFAYAIALGKAADRLARAEELPAPATVLRELAAVRTGPAAGDADDEGLADGGTGSAAVGAADGLAGLAGLPTLDQQRLVRLAAAASRTAATNARLEIYPRDLDLVRALRLTQAGVPVPPQPGGPDEPPDRPLVDVATIRERVQNRFPGLATELPAHPALDAPLAAAGFILEWNAARDGYVPPHGLLSSTGLGSRATPVVRQATGLGSRPARTVFDSPDRAAAALAEQRLTAAAEAGGFRALTVRRNHYLAARAELTRPHRFAAEPVDVAAVFLDALHAEVDPRPRPTWATILRADAAEPGSRAAGNLAEYVRTAWSRAAPQLTALIDAPANRNAPADRNDPADPADHAGPGRRPAPLLLHDAGVFGRYDGRGLDVLFALAERARAGGRPVWVLCPTTEPTRPPRLDGALVQLITESEWVALPDAWVTNRHRAAGEDTGLAGIAS
ncbi:BREX system serine/threonine kinase PglW [Frankia tisae]|uniref:BREX system serine/threonine kinase PglW n=1 Tax=Frankia tisae TaxID=2950104 RepID=UPI0021BDF8D0|nr:BREX system serine/threonine kinase PglW [Frankia tisae]